MDLVDKIDPAEVLAHLQQLGYQNITPVQLKEFIRDLKKLIIHDQLSSSSSSSSGSLTSLSSSVSSDTEYFSTTDTSIEQTAAQSNICVNRKPMRKCTLHKSKNTGSSIQGVSNVSSTTARSGRILQRASTSSSSISEMCPQKENIPVRRERAKSISEENLREAVRPKTSFIRPWQLQSSISGPARTGVSDPVSRYHYYQAMWAKQKCPGEDSHADLRWVVREKMLGQDPHLYSKNVLGKKTNRLRL